MTPANAACATDAPAPAVVPGWLRSPRVRDQLVAVESRLRAYCETDDPWTTDVCSHLFRAGGKRLRPALLLLAAEFGDPSRHEAAIDGAAAIELLHIATLYHDDVSDEAMTRRGQPSVNRLWGNGAAVFAGIRLFSSAIERITTYGAEATGMVSAAMSEVWKGQTQETENIHNLDLDQSTYFDIVRRKTAAMCELPCRLGAVLTEVDPRHVEALGAYGRHLGCAFQIVDDVLDIVGHATSLGKRPGTDVLEGVYTLPILYALRTPSSDARLLVILQQRTLRPEDVEEALALVRQSGAITAAVRVARECAAQAVAQLRSVPPGPARDSLTRLAHDIVARAPLEGHEP